MNIEKELEDYPQWILGDSALFEVGIYADGDVVFGGTEEYFDYPDDVNCKM